MTVLSEAVWPGDALQFGTASVPDYSFSPLQLFPRSSTTLVNPEELTEEAREILSKIKSFSSLKAGWDSYGAEPPSNVAIHNSLRLVKSLDRQRVAVYFTAPGPNGEVLVELKRGNKSVEVTFEPNGESTYAKFLGDDCVEEDSFGDQGSSQLIQWLSS